MEMQKEKRKLEIAAMSRKELNAHAFLCEQEQEEYEAQVNAQQTIISQQSAEIERMKRGFKRILKTPQGEWEITSGEGQVECLNIAREFVEAESI